MNYPLMLDVRSSNHFDGVREALLELSTSEVYWDITCHCADVELSMSRFILGLVFPCIGDHVVAYLPDYTSEDILEMARSAISNMKSKERQQPIYIQPRNSFSQNSVVKSIGNVGVRDSDRQMFRQHTHPSNKPDGDEMFEDEDPLRDDSPSLTVDPTDIMEVIADEGDAYSDQPVLVDFSDDPVSQGPHHFSDLVLQERNQQQNILLQQKKYFGHSEQHFRPPTNTMDQSVRNDDRTSESTGRNIITAADSTSDGRGSSFIYKSGQQQFIRFYSSPSNGLKVPQEGKECDIKFLRSKYKSCIKECNVTIPRMKPSKELEDDLLRYRIQKYLHGQNISLPPRKKIRCQKCHSCNIPDCLVCVHCRDMKKYGGPHKLKKSCKSRPKCELLV